MIKGIGGGNPKGDRLKSTTTITTTTNSTKSKSKNSKTNFTNCYYSKTNTYCYTAKS